MHPQHNLLHFLQLLFVDCESAVQRLPEESVDYTKLGFLNLLISITLLNFRRVFLEGGKLRVFKILGVELSHRVVLG